MKHLNHIFTTLVIIMATAFSVNAQSDKEILESLAEGLEIGLKQEMNNASMKGIMTGGNCEYNGQDLVLTLEYTFTLDNTTQENINLMISNFSTESIKLTQSRNLSVTFDTMLQKDTKDLIINTLKRNNCRLVYNIYYNFPTTTKHCNFAITADEIDKKDVSKEEFIELMLKNYNKALKIEIENGRAVDGRVEFNGRDIVLTYVLNIDKEMVENMDVDLIEKLFVEQMKSDAISLAEMRQFKLNDIDFVLAYEGINGGRKEVTIDSSQF